MSDQPAPQPVYAAIEAVRAAIEDATEIPNLLAERAVEALVTTPYARTALLDALDAVPRSSLRQSDCQHDDALPPDSGPCGDCFVCRSDRAYREHYDRAECAEAERDRVRREATADLDEAQRQIDRLKDERDRLREALGEADNLASEADRGDVSVYLGGAIDDYKRVRAALDGGDS